MNLTVIQSIKVHLYCTCLYLPCYRPIASWGGWGKGVEGFSSPQLTLFQLGGQVMPTTVIQTTLDFVVHLHQFLVVVPLSKLRGATVRHSDLKCLTTFVNSKMVKFQIFNFFLLQVVVYILYFDNSMLKLFCFHLMTIFGQHEVTPF